MDHNITSRWERYEQALLTALGCTAIEGRVHAYVFRLLLVPTFQPVCAFEYAWLGEAGSFRHAALPTMTNPIAEYMWDRSQATEVSAIEEVMFSCLENVTLLEGDKGRELLHRFSTLERPSVSAEDLAARDGIAVRLDLRDEHEPFSFRAQIASIEASPALSAWISVFLKAAQEHTQERRLSDQLKRLPSSLGLTL